MLALFLLFPRVEGPLWGLPQVNYGAKSGLSDVMSPGDVSALSLSDEVAFRVLFETPPEKPSQFYWRGPVLWDFDGRTWRAGQIYTADSIEFEALGPPLNYTVTLEPHDQRWMFAIDLPTRAAPSSYFSTDYQLLARRPVRERIRYDMQSCRPTVWASTNIGCSCVARCGFPMARPRGRGAGRARGAPNCPATATSCCGRWRCSGSSRSSTPWRRRNSARIRSTSFCSTPAAASASTTRRHSRS